MSEHDHDSKTAGFGWYAIRLALASAAALAAYMLMYGGDAFGAGSAVHFGNATHGALAILTGGKVTCLCIPH